MSALGLIPARIGSTRLPRKLLADVCGLPMIVRTARAVRRCGDLERVVVATDSDEIAHAVRRDGGEAVITGENCATGTDRVVAAARQLGIARSEDSLVVNVQGDEPLVDASHLSDLIAHMWAHRDQKMGTLAASVAGEAEFLDPSVVKVVRRAADGYAPCSAQPGLHTAWHLLTLARRGARAALYFSRAPIPHTRDAARFPPWRAALRHIGVYAFRSPFLLDEFPLLPPSELEDREMLEQLRALDAGVSIGVVRVPSALPGVDTAEQLAAVRQLFRDGRVPDE